MLNVSLYMSLLQGSWFFAEELDKDEKVCSLRTILIYLDLNMEKP